MGKVTITSLHVYPVKSCRGIDLTEATLTSTGILHDRQWMFVTPDGKKLSQREAPQMALIGTAIDQQHLILSHPELPVLKLQLVAKISERMAVQIWSHACEALCEGREADAWGSKACGKDVRLVRFDPLHLRFVDEKWAGKRKAVTMFADVLPLLVTSEESLAMVNEIRKVEGLPPSPMNRFRPNIVVRGLPAYAEDEIPALKLPRTGERIELVRPCSRCPITNVDQITGEREARGNLQLLGEHRRLQNYTGSKGAMFGVQGFPAIVGNVTLRLGDSLEVCTLPGIDLPPLPRLVVPKEG